jgi:hypothetical protein
MGTKTYDVKCSELAERFLSDEKWFKNLVPNLQEKKRFIADLASEIQQTIEDQLQHYRDSRHTDL